MTGQTESMTYKSSLQNAPESWSVKCPNHLIKQKQLRDCEVLAECWLHYMCLRQCGWLKKMTYIDPSERGKKLQIETVVLHFI